MHKALGDVQCDAIAKRQAQVHNTSPEARGVDTLWKDSREYVGGNYEREVI